MKLSDALVLLIVGFVIVTIGALAMVGHLFRWPLAASWGFYTEMAFPTAFCLILVGAEFILRSRRVLNTLRNERNH